MQKAAPKVARAGCARCRAYRAGSGFQEPAGIWADRAGPWTCGLSDGGGRHAKGVQNMARPEPHSITPRKGCVGSRTVRPVPPQTITMLPVRGDKERKRRYPWLRWPRNPATDRSRTSLRGNRLGIPSDAQRPRAAPSMPCVPAMRGAAAGFTWRPTAVLTVRPWGRTCGSSTALPTRGPRSNGSPSALAFLPFGAGAFASLTASSWPCSTSPASSCSTPRSASASGPSTPWGLQGAPLCSRG